MLETSVEHACYRLEECFKERVVWLTLNYVVRLCGTAGSRKAVTLFSETVHDRRHAPIEIARTHLVRVS